MLEIIRRGPLPADPNMKFPTGTMDIHEASRILTVVIDHHESGLPETPTIEMVVCKHVKLGFT